MTLATTQDIFFLALAVATVVLTFFLGWLLYYLISIFRDARNVTEKVAEGFDKIHRILDGVNESVRASSMHLTTIVAALREVVGFFGSRKKKKSPRETRENLSDDAV